MYSLRALFGAVAFAALVAGALVYRSPFLGSVVFSLTLVVGVAAAIAAWQLPESRGFYGTLAIVIASYMALLFGPAQIAQNLISNQLIFRTWPEVSTFTPIFVPDEELWAYWQEIFFRDDLDFFEKMGLRRVMYELRVFYYTIHSAFALLLGFVAGSITVWCGRRRLLIS